MRNLAFTALLGLLVFAPPALAQQAPPAGQAVDPSAADRQGAADISVDQIPNFKVEELTPELARKAIDGFVIQHEKYKDGPISDYDKPADYVAKDKRGKEFEADLKALGFKDADDWDVAVMSITVAYNMALADQTPEIKQQIDEFQARGDLSAEQKAEAVRRLQVQIPSPNNAKIIDDLTKDPAYAEKIKMFESSEE